MFIVVANWKSQLTFQQALSLCKDNIAELTELGYTDGIELVVCPSFEALRDLSELFADTGLQIGAQNCSVYKTGAYTGEVLAASLAEVGCTYCIIGHGERRANFKESDLDVAMKVERLLEVGIEPIICIGETRQEYEAHMTIEVLGRQLEPIFERLAHRESTLHASLCIAYEPIWAIGTGILPQARHLEEVFAWLQQKCALALPTNPCRFLYGGSVNVANVAKIRAIPCVGGLLIGSASLDFQNLQKIVSSCS